MIKAVIFDVDNTLIDFLRMKRASCEAAIDAMIDAGLDMDKDKALESLYELYYKEGLEDQMIFQKFLKKVNGSVDYKLLSYGVIAYRNMRAGYIKPYPGVKKTLIQLKEMGLKLAVVSDAPKVQAWIRLSSMKLDDFFDVIVAFEDTGRWKPSTLPFKAALKQLKVKPEECIMIGDNPDRDVKGAKAMGMVSVLAGYGYEGKKKVKADYIIDKVEDLVEIIKEKN